LAQVDGLTAYQVGGARERLGVFPFTMTGWHHSQLASALDAGWGVATRDGCFCAHPLMVDLLGVGGPEMERIRQDMVGDRMQHVPGMVRASLGVYNDRQDVDVLVEALTSLARRGRQNGAAASA
jgi:selenocysteine lyase/cysteine desulfurase